MRELVLASGSRTRLQLLTAAGLQIAAVPARVDEQSIAAAMLAEGANPQDIADGLAEAKAQKVAAKLPQALVLGCDQVLSLGHEVLFKAEDRALLRDQLLRLRDREHLLYSAAVLYDQGAPIWRHVGKARLRMRAFSEAYLDSYLDRNWPAVGDCVGGYQIEGEGIRLFASIEGDHATILGLPLLPLLNYLTLRGFIES